MAKAPLPADLALQSPVLNRPTKMSFPECVSQNDVASVEMIYL
jgi:hypothetical protein